MFRKLKLILVLVLFICGAGLAQRPSGTAISSSTTITQSGDYYISADFDGYIWVGSEDNRDIEVSLDLNGHTLHYNSAGKPIIKNYARLTVVDNVGGGGIDGGNVHSKYIGRAIRNEGGSVTIDIGNDIIQNCITEDASGAALGNYTSNSVMYFISGIIQNCTSDAYGGAVYVSSESTFVMGETGSSYVPQILSCCSPNYSGGAIYNKGNVTINSGTIDGCYCKNYGGAINAYDGVLP